MSSQENQRQRSQRGEPEGGGGRADSVQLCAKCTLNIKCHCAIICKFVVMAYNHKVVFV